MAGLLTLRVAAAQANLPVSALWRAARAGGLATIRLTPRGRYYVLPTDLDAWLAQHRRASVAPASARPASELASLLPARRRFA